MAIETSINKMSELFHIDSVAIERLHRLGGNKLVNEMIRSFIENIPKKIGDAFEGENKVNLKAVEMAAHSIKSSAGNLGAVLLQELALETEEHAASGMPGGLFPKITRMQEAFEAAKACLLKEREK